MQVKSINLFCTLFSGVWRVLLLCIFLLALKFFPGSFQDFAFTQRMLFFCARQNTHRKFFKYFQVHIASVPKFYQIHTLNPQIIFFGEFQTLTHKVNSWMLLQKRHRWLMLINIWLLTFNLHAVIIMYSSLSLRSRCAAKFGSRFCIEYVIL